MSTAKAPKAPAPRPMGGGFGRGSLGGPQPVQKAMDFTPSARRLLGRLAPEWHRVMAVVALGVTSVVLAVIGPRILGYATDVIFSGAVGRALPAGLTAQEATEAARARGDDNYAAILQRMDVVPGRGVDLVALRNFLLLALGIYAASSLFLWLQGSLLNGIVQRTVFALRSEAEDKLHRLPLQFFDRQPRGELLSRVTNDIDNVSQTLQQTLSQLLTSLLTVIGVLGAMFVVSPLLALIALVTVPLSVLVTAGIAKRSQKLFVTQWAQTGQLNGHIEETFTGHELVKVFGRQAETEQVFKERNDKLYDASFGAQFISGIIMPTMMFVGNLNYVAIAVAGGIRVATGSMSLGEVQAFIQYSRQFTQPLSQVASMANVLQSGVASAERVFALLDADEQVPDSTGVPEAPSLHKRGGRVQFEHVSFRYAADEPLIEDLSLVAEPGQTVAIVGPTGAGKTTLVNLLLRFYELDAGRITLDGIDITAMSRNALRSQVGIVLQDTWLFGGTIRENIAYGNLSATDEQVRQAAEATFVDRFVRSLPDGYDTVIDDDASNISAGEKQLLTIARAFLSRPSLLILDEATSSVDTRTEVLVQRAMSALRSDRTSFVIAHRLSTIREADLILVMEHGDIVEQGTHRQLIDAGGAYATLYDAQFRAPEADLDSA